jgi:hypothetical protein
MRGWSADATSNGEKVHVLIGDNDLIATLPREVIGASLGASGRGIPLAHRAVARSGKLRRIFGYWF